MIKMPPQAYTKEVLTAAFDWLSSQPEYVRQKISSSDDLVGLYLKSTRLKQDFNKDLSSAKNFRNELQDLAQNLKQFEEKEEPIAKPPQASRTLSMPPSSGFMGSSGPSGEDLTGSGHASSAAPYSQASTSLGRGFDPEAAGMQQTPSSIGAQQLSPQHFVSASEVVGGAGSSGSSPLTPPSVPQGIGKAPSMKAHEKEIVFKLDQKTISALNLAKDRLNLSSDTEALRVLVSLGEKHLKKLFSSED